MESGLSSKMHEFVLFKVIGETNGIVIELTRRGQANAKMTLETNNKEKPGYSSNTSGSQRGRTADGMCRPVVRMIKLSLHPSVCRAHTDGS